MSGTRKYVYLCQLRDQRSSAVSQQGIGTASTTTGNAVTTTYFDADAASRTQLAIRAISGTVNSDVTTVTAYDYTGAKTFASYPVSGSPAACLRRSPPARITRTTLWSV